MSTLIRSGEEPTRVTTRFRAAVITIALTVLASPQATHAQDVVVFAAASLTNALDKAAQLFERQGGAHAKISYAARVRSALFAHLQQSAAAPRVVQRHKEGGRSQPQIDDIEYQRSEQKIGSEYP